ncbi:MAG: DUF2232 domain-containing protein [Alphaproteobacteria bacterium]|nr:DUF2232 domain-containing protein [Alphaproteobacteria bacterium]MBF0251839.1 DUF2232 domain-containing protein [Alphaproteobacteria bacterium]
MATASMAGGVMGAFLFSLLHPLPVLAAGLALGAKPALIAAIASAGFVFLALPTSGLLFAASYAAPIWLTVRLVLTSRSGVAWSRGSGDAPVDERDWYPVGGVLAVMTVVAGAFLVAGSLFTGGGLEDAVKAAMTELGDALVDMDSATPEQRQAQELLRMKFMGFVPYFAGLAAGMWTLVLLVNAVLAQRLVAGKGANIRPTPRYKDLTLPDWLSWALVASALAALIGPGEMGYIGRSLTIAFAVPFFLLGLAVAHSAAARTAYASGLLTALYVLAVLSGWFILVIAGIGIVEQWVGLRNRMRPIAPQEDEQS